MHRAKAWITLRVQNAVARGGKRARVRLNRQANGEIGQPLRSAHDNSVNFTGYPLSPGASLSNRLASFLMGCPLS